MTDDTAPLVSRRTAFTGAGLILAAAMTDPARAETGALEKANMKVVADFLKAWSAADATGAGLTAFMSDDSEFRYERKAPVVGKAALTAAFDAYLAGGKRYEMKPLETHALGPAVVHFRHETPLTAGKAGHTETLVGLFILAGGKIKAWENFLAET
jgi:limonene-1,2-epoxide hydrolase